jgi:hypothetical protein
VSFDFQLTVRGIGDGRASEFRQPIPKLIIVLLWKLRFTVKFITSSWNRKLNKDLSPSAERSALLLPILLLAEVFFIY